MKPFLLLQVRPETAAADNEYQAFLKFSGLEPQQLLRLRIETGGTPTINIHNYSGIILGGGPYNASDPDAKKTSDQQKCEAWLFELMDKIVEADFPFLGTCYGIGVVGAHQKGLISRRYGEDVGAVVIDLVSEGVNDKLTSGLPPSFPAFVGHKEACEVLPESAVLLASSATCPVQMFRVKNNIYATQFHTELDPAGLELRIQIYKNYGYFPPEQADALIKKGYEQQVTEPVKILSNFVKFYKKDNT